MEAVNGVVSEWFKEAVLKTVVPQGTGGSNPPCSEYHWKWFDFVRGKGYDYERVALNGPPVLERCMSG